MQIDLNTKTITELKAIAYDLISQIEKIKHELNVVNQLIFDKQNIKDEPNK
jgi:uncharacterized protein YfkK (UPF0435 family)